MVRTIVSVSENDKRWLDQYSRQQKQSTAQTIRMAVKQFQRTASASSGRAALDRTAGVLKGKLSPDFVHGIRREWS